MRKFATRNRALVGGAVATLVSLFGTRYLIIFFRTRGQGQPILGKEDLGPEHHMAKQGTPTMGGMLILLALSLATLLWADLTNGYVWAVLLVTLGFGAIGVLDDYKKLTDRKSVV